VKLKFDDEPNLTEAVRWLFEGVADIYPWLKLIAQQQETILSNQDDLDVRAARIEAANTAVAAAIADLKAQVAAGVPAAALSFDRIDAAISGEEALEPAPVVAPVAPAAPVVDPSAPVVDPSAPVVTSPTAPTS
jgi:hypothetical protein